jgi:hypothetical protein
VEGLQFFLAVPVGLAIAIVLVLFAEVELVDAAHLEDLILFKHALRLPVAHSN